MISVSTRLACSTRQASTPSATATSTACLLYTSWRRAWERKRGVIAAASPETDGLSGDSVRFGRQLPQSGDEWLVVQGAYGEHVRRSRARARQAPTVSYTHLDVYKRQLQWVALAANIALMLLMGAFVQSLVEGGDVAASRANLVMAAAAAIVVRVCCLTLSQRMGQAAAAAAKRTVRKLVYDKLVRLGPSYSERVSTSEAVQVSVEGTEQLESYFGSYLPQLFYSCLLYTSRCV